LSIAAEHLQGMNVPHIGRFRPRRAASGGFGQCEEFLQKLGGGFGFFAVLSGYAHFLKDGLKVKPLLNVQRRHVDVEAGDADLVLRERSCLHRLAIDGGAKVAGDQHHKERAIHRVLRPAVWSGPKVLTDVLAFFAGPNEIEDTTADSVLGHVAWVAHLRERTNVTGTRPVDDLPPIGVIGLGKLRKEALQGAVC
jgi:hypothetical protein